MDTHTHAHMRLFPVKPRRRPERGTVRSAAAGELELWQAGKSRGEDALGAVLNSCGCWCQPVIWGGKTLKQPAAGEVVI